MLRHEVFTMRRMQNDAFAFEIMFTLRARTPSRIAHRNAEPPGAKAQADSEPPPGDSAFLCTVRPEQRTAGRAREPLSQ